MYVSKVQAAHKAFLGLSYWFYLGFVRLTVDVVVVFFPISFFNYLLSASYSASQQLIWLLQLLPQVPISPSPHDL
jgi:hypothetical protein